MHPRATNWWTPVYHLALLRKARNWSQIPRAEVLSNVDMQCPCTACGSRSAGETMWSESDSLADPHYSVLLLTLNLLVDVVYGMLDKRVNYG